MSKICYTIVFFIFIFHTTYSQYQQQWVTAYSNGSGYDNPVSIKTDLNGNIYVTGSSNGSGTFGDIFTIKYNSSGIQQWLCRYNGVSNHDDRANSLFVDSVGNVYVTGEVGVAYPNPSDFVTIKYSSSGVQQWIQFYNSSSNDEDRAYSVAADNSGNVYVTGTCKRTGTNFDISTIKYNSTGVQQWVQFINGTHNKNDGGTSIALDQSGNVYVTGFIDTTASSFNYPDYLTVKYNSSGVQQWVQIYSDGLINKPVDIKVDDLGNAYITGSCGNYWQYTTIKYNATGVQQWVQSYNTGGGNTIATSIGIDYLRNVIITGYNYSVNGFGIVTIKYNTNGVQQWLQRYDGTGTVNNYDAANSLAIDKTGNIYVTGCSETGSSNYTDLCILKYNANGVQQWVQLYNGSSNISDEGKSIAVDTSGNIFVTGHCNYTGSSQDGNCVTLKYSIPVGITKNTNNIPTGFSLSQNYPNPFNPSTIIKYSIPEQSHVIITLYDVPGKEISTLVNEVKQAGEYETEFYGSALASGIYFYKITAGDFSEVKKMILIK